MEALFTKGPMTVSVDAAPKSFSFYQSGVYNEPTCQSKLDKLDHAVIVSGYKFMPPIIALVCSLELDVKSNITAQIGIRVGAGSAQLKTARITGWSRTLGPPIGARMATCALLGSLMTAALQRSQSTLNLSWSEPNCWLHDG